MRASLALMMVMMIAGCGKSANAPGPRLAAKPDVIVTVSGKHTCVIALYAEGQGSIVSCDDAASFVRDELRLPSGSIYDIHAAAGTDADEMARVSSRLNGAGFRFIGGS